MLDWESASTATKATMLGALGLMGVGILLALLGAGTSNRPLMFLALGLMALGIITHLVGWGIRLAEARRRLRSTEKSAGPARKGRR